MPMIDVSRKGPIAIVRYDRGGTANALNLNAITALTEVARSFEEDTETHVIVVTGTPTRFCAGVDLSDNELWHQDADAVVRHHLMSKGGAMCNAWARLPQVTIAALEGPVIGGGAVFALSLDMRVMAADARMRLPEVRLGLTLGWGGLPRLTALAGASRAKRILFADTEIDAASAERWGLADAMASPTEALDTALSLAREIALCPPLAMRLTKRAIDAQADMSRYAHADADQFFLARSIAERARDEPIPAKDRG